MVTAKLISIIGPPAVGKTTLAEALARELPAEAIYEDYAGNPFLAESYTRGGDARLPAQLYYLMSRVKQLGISNWPSDGLCVSDYGFCQDRVFAEAKLEADDLHLYGRVARRVEGLVKSPDVLIGLDASVETLLGRIAARGRDFERVMDAAFLSRMREAYEGVESQAACPVVRVDCEKTDFREVGGVARVVQQVRGTL